MRTERKGSGNREKREWELKEKGVGTERKRRGN